MSAIPPECQDLASRVQSLEAAEAAARGATTGLVGSEAWGALERLASVRRELDQARAALDACVDGDAGALEMQLVVVQGGPAPLPTGRQAYVYEPGQADHTARSRLVGDRFWFGGPLPPRFAVLVVADGVQADGAAVVDFRSGPLEAGHLGRAAQARAEIVVGPVIDLTAADVHRWSAAIPLPIETDVMTPAGAVRVALHTVGARLANVTLSVTATGQVDWPGGILPSQVTATLQLAFGLPQSPMDVEPCQVRVVGVPEVQILGGAGAVAGLVLPLLRDRLSAVVAERVQKALVLGVRELVARSFALAELPAEATVAIRLLTVAEDAITVQPVVGAMGTLLSTFQPPATA